MENASTELSDTDGSRADIGLVCALPLELGEFRDRCSKMKTYTGGKFTFRGGLYKQIRIAIVESGPGPDRARRAAYALHEAHTPRWIVSTGFCGALVSEIEIGHIVVANKVTTIAGDELAIDVGMTTDIRRGLHVGRTLTVDHMIRTIVEKRALAEQTGAIAVDMETHAIASLCRQQKTKFLAVRVASDNLSGDLPAEVLSLVGETGAVRIGAVIGSLWKRPSSFKDLGRLRENAMLAGERLANFLEGVVQQLHQVPE